MLVSIHRAFPVSNGMKYELVVGLEIHAELKTKTKMFCSSRNDPDEKHPNVNICPVCMGHPGTLPVINKQAVESLIKVGLSLGASIPEYSKFDRKNYFYPDLPKGYQISQYDKPFCVGGTLSIGDRDIRITRVHLEEDTGKSIHVADTDYSLLDFNRAGVPLMELVTEPDIRKPEEARRFAQELQLLLRYLGVSEANMEKGQMRVEANISLRPEGEERFGTKVEVKNMNSFRAVEEAIRYEVERQRAVLEEGGKIVQETRGWNEDSRSTFSQRSKEEAHDYRYFPEPDLPVIRIFQGMVSEGEGGLGIPRLLAEIPELPAGRRKRFKAEYDLRDEDIEIFVVQKALGDYFEHVVSEINAWIEAEGREPASLKTVSQLAANYLISDLQKLMGDASASAGDLLITPENFAELIKSVFTGEISSRTAKDVLREMFGSGRDPSQIIEEKGLKQVSDTSQLEGVVDAVIQKNPQAVEDYKKGKEASLQFLLGHVMKETRGAANPEVAKEVILKKVSGA